jgi:hypothetical protein
VRHDGEVCQTSGIAVRQLLGATVLQPELVPAALEPDQVVGFSRLFHILLDAVAHRVAWHRREDLVKPAPVDSIPAETAASSTNDRACVPSEFVVFGSPDYPPPSCTYRSLRRLMLCGWSASVC